MTCRKMVGWWLWSVLVCHGARGADGPFLTNGCGNVARGEAADTQRISGRCEAKLAWVRQSGTGCLPRIRSQSMWQVSKLYAARTRELQRSHGHQRPFLRPVRTQARKTADKNQLLRIDVVDLPAERQQAEPPLVPFFQNSSAQHLNQSVSRRCAILCYVYSMQTCSTK